MLISRRAALGAGAAATMLAGTARAAQPLAGTQAPAFFRSKLGAFEITSINDGVAYRPLDGFIKNASLDDQRKVLGEAFLAQDKITIPFTSLVVNTGSKLVLLDSGNGDLGATTTGSWMANFRAAGFDPDKVDVVIASHFHGDHINGMRLKSGQAVFPNAEIMVAASEWAFWMDDAKMAQAPDGMKPAFQNVRRVFAPIAKDITRYEWGKEIVPGISAVAAPGHTPGHTVFAIQSGSAKFLMMSDLTNNTEVFVRRPDWQAIVDMDGEQARQTRHRMLDMAASEGMQVAFYHAPFPATGHIARDGAAYRLVHALWTPTV
jgi:glyoxylase-like metal-dependent hydrolase (beta-lactamase superfamily II)